MRDEQHAQREANEAADPNRRDGSAVPKHEQSKGTEDAGSEDAGSDRQGRDEPPPSARRSKDSPWMGGG